MVDEPVIAEIAERLGRTPAQVVLRWHVERGNIVFPKSTTPERMQENFELFDFELEPRDHEAIDALERGEEGRTGPHPDSFAYAQLAQAVSRENVEPARRARGVRARRC